MLRAAKAPVIVAVNKADNPKRELEAAEFHVLGWPETHAISALHGRGVADLLDVVVWALPPESQSELERKRAGGGGSATSDGSDSTADADGRSRLRLRRPTGHGSPSSAGPTSARARCSTRCSASNAPS